MQCFTNWCEIDVAVISFDGGGDVGTFSSEFDVAVINFVGGGDIGTFSS